MDDSVSKPEKQILSIIIITKDTADLLDALLRSIGDDADLQSCLREVLVVDNASADGTEEMVKNRYPWVGLIRNEQNMGFARAVNAGFRQSTGKYVLLMNSDTLVRADAGDGPGGGATAGHPGGIIKMLLYMEDTPDIGVCGPQLVFPDMRPQRSFAHTPRLLFEIVPKSLLETLFPRIFGTRTEAGRINPVGVDSLIGAAIMVRRETHEALSGFDERFFFFLEETDFCLRARNRGYGTVFFPEAKIVHYQGGTVKKQWVRGRIEYNISLYKFIRKHHRPSYYGIFVGVRFIKCTLALCTLTVFPFLLIKARTRLSYAYYARLFAWHFTGCPDSGGLRESK